MTLIGEVFVGDVIGKPVLDPVGEEMGRLRDIAVEGGGPLPRAAGLLLEKKNKVLYLPWEDLSIFNRRIISSRTKSTIFIVNLDYAAQDALYASTCQGLFRWNLGKWIKISSYRAEQNRWRPENLELDAIAF